MSRTKQKRRRGVRPLPRTPDTGPTTGVTDELQQQNQVQNHGHDDPDIALIMEQDEESETGLLDAFEADQAPMWERDTKDLFKAQDSGDAMNSANAEIWHKTLFTKDANAGPDQSRVLDEQQDMLKRNFLTMAVMGLEQGDQKGQNFMPVEDSIHDKNLSRADDEQFTMPNLATMASGGGRIGYESGNDGGAERGGDLYNMITTGDRDSAPDVHSKQRKSSTKTAGLYDRISTHKSEYVDNHWEETSKNGASGVGFNLALGGVGNEVEHHDKDGLVTTVGHEGRANARKGTYQMGTGLFRNDVDEDNDTSRLMVGFEGTAPHARSQIGAEHRTVGTLMKMAKNELSGSTSMTGQAKGKAFGLDTQSMKGKKEKVGKKPLIGKQKKELIDGSSRSVSAVVTDEKMDRLEEAIAGLQGLDEVEQSELFKELLTTTEQGERDRLIDQLIGD